MCQALSLLSPAPKGHPALFVPQLGTLRAQGLFCFYQVAFQALVFQVGKKNPIPAEPLLKSRQVTKLTQGLILSDGRAQGAFFSHNSILSVLREPQK